MKSLNALIAVICLITSSLNAMEEESGKRGASSISNPWTRPYEEYDPLRDGVVVRGEFDKLKFRSGGSVFPGILAGVGSNQALSHSVGDEACTLHSNGFQLKRRPRGGGCNVIEQQQRYDQALKDSQKPEEQEPRVNNLGSRRDGFQLKRRTRGGGCNVVEQQQRYDQN